MVTYIRQLYANEHDEIAWELWKVISANNVLEMLHAYINDVGIYTLTVVSST